ncbi:hypothetical protein GCM10028825_23440 [Spirosoma agri]
MEAQAYPYGALKLSPATWKWKHWLNRSPNVLLYAESLNDKHLKISGRFIYRIFLFCTFADTTKDTLFFKSQTNKPSLTCYYDTKINITGNVERIWDIDGFPNYFFGHDKQLYRFDSRGCLKRNKRVVVCYTMG